MGLFKYIALLQGGAGICEDDQQFNNKRQSLDIR